MTKFPPAAKTITRIFLTSLILILVYKFCEEERAMQGDKQVVINNDSYVQDYFKELELQRENCALDECDKFWIP